MARPYAVLAFVAVGLFAGCSERAPAGSGASGGADASADPAAGTGTVGATLTLPGGEHVSRVSYTLINAANRYAGLVDVSGSDTVSFVIGGVAAGDGYDLQMTAVSDDGVVTCKGDAGPLSVSNRATTAVHVQLFCEAASDAGSLILGIDTGNCAVWNTIVANPKVADYGGTLTLNAAATAPDPNGITFAWQVISGTGTVGNNVSALSADGAGKTDTATFTCPTTGETDTIELVVSDGPLPDGGACPATLTTGTVQVNCGRPPCSEFNGIPASPNSATGICPTGMVNTGTARDIDGVFCCTPVACFGLGGVVATPDSATGSCPAGTANTGTRDAQGNYCCTSASPPPPCTQPGQSNCTPCAFSTNGVCSATEALFIQHDIAKAGQSDAGADAGALDTCYRCLVNAGCLDDTAFGDSNNECDEMTGTLNGSSKTTLCLNVVSCILGSSCASPPSACYCGTAGVSTACQGNPAPGPITGACDTQIAAGLGFPVTDGTDIVKNLTDTTKPAGRADQIFQCAASSGCNDCLR
jgi:hypothetical protein